MRILRVIGGIALCICLAGCSVILSRTPPSGVQVPQTCKLNLSETQTVQGQYYLFLPRAYHRSFWKKWPLILYLHGASLRGDDLIRLKTYGLPKVIDEMPDFPFILVSPQLAKGKRWSPDVLIALLDELLETYRIDPDRLYLTGVSLGGFGTWETAIAYPDRFAAIAPVSGGGDPRMVSNITHIPVWVFHGAKDRTVPIRRAQEMVNALQKLGGDVTFTIYPKGGHSIFMITYRNPELYEWFLKHSR